MLRRRHLLLCASWPTFAAFAREPVVGLPCEGCELVFEGMPVQLSSAARLAPAAEPGEPLHVFGRVLDPSGNPRQGVVVYAYQTNAGGIYPAAQANRHGRLRAWVMSDVEGRFAFETIRPGAYPNSSVPQHIHMHVIEPGCATYYIDDILFTDDPLFARRQAAGPGRGGTGVVTPLRKSGVWQVTRDIRLGLAIPGHPGCAAP